MERALSRIKTNSASIDVWFIKLLKKSNFEVFNAFGVTYIYEILWLFSLSLITYSLWPQKWFLLYIYI